MKGLIRKKKSLSSSSPCCRNWHLDLWSGCRGFKGPVPPPLWIRVLQLSASKLGGLYHACLGLSRIDFGLILSGNVNSYIWMSCISPAYGFGSFPGHNRRFPFQLSNLTNPPRSEAGTERICRHPDPIPPRLLNAACTSFPSFLARASSASTCIRRFSPADLSPRLLMLMRTL
jgi:hypothetical protein